MDNLVVINRSRVRSLERHLSAVPRGAPIMLAVRVTEARRPLLEAAGLSGQPEPGDSVLPAVRGPVSRFNAEGREIVRRDLPMERVTRQAWWTWKQWHGRGTIERQKLVDIPYDRYPRDLVPPPSVELRCEADEDGALFLVVDGGAYDPADEDLLHRVNLMLELFGECEVRRPDLAPFVPSRLRRLNWEVLPKGRLPWGVVRTAVESILTRAKPGNRPVIEERLKAIEFFSPDFHAVGRGGFSGYVVFGFERLGLYVLESAHYGNATYVLGEEWERLSQMTKAQLLEASLHEERIVHRSASWLKRIRELLAPALEVATKEKK